MRRQNIAPTQASADNEAAYARLVAEARRVGWPQANDNDLVTSDYNRLHGINGNPIPATFGWNLRPAGTSLAAVGHLIDFEIIDSHRTIYGTAGIGNYYRDDGSTLRQCTLAELATWLGKQLDPTPYAEAVAVAAEARWQARPPHGSPERDWRSYREANARWEEAKAHYERALAIAERYRFTIGGAHTDHEEYP